MILLSAETNRFMLIIYGIRLKMDLGIFTQQGVDFEPRWRGEDPILWNPLTRVRIKCWRLEEARESGQIIFCMDSKFIILIAEDSEEDALIVQHCLKRAGLPNPTHI